MRGSSYRFAGPARVARGLVLGSAVLLLTALAHASGGAPVSATSVIWLLPLTATLSVLAADRRRSRRWLVAYLLGVQFLLHLLLVTSGGHHGHAADLLPSAAMITAHVLAAAGAAVVLAHADAVLHRWLRFLDCLSRPSRIPVPGLSVSSDARGTVVAGTDSRVGRRLELTSPRRGPPLPAFG